MECSAASIQRWERNFFSVYGRGEYLGPRGMKMGSGNGPTMRNFIICTVYLIESGSMNLDGQAIYPEWRKLEVLSKF